MEVLFLSVEKRVFSGILDEVWGSVVLHRLAFKNSMKLKRHRLGFIEEERVQLT